ncbi:hypothetical protein WH47_01439 [Habropoda laboriosa]|uniref:Transposable element Tc3 transposase n=1 Tax=Habropoda laboriosa TaxID=597456 RepID=A0A0L7R5M6_9HYME|nr:hypothetical protein WH47_01439 [Habropoda laboriosa]
MHIYEQLWSTEHGLHLRQERNARKILWTDECTFTNNGMFNGHIQHVWSTENPYLKRCTNNQLRYIINMRCGILKELGHPDGLERMQSFFGLMDSS